MTTKLEHSNTALCNKRIPAKPPLFFDGSFISDYCKKANLFNTLINI